MGASPYRQQGSYRASPDEFRWTVATVVALACCSAALIAASALSMIGNGIERSPSALTRLADEIAYDFEALRTPATSGHDAAPKAAASPESRTQCVGQTWPYFSDDCLWRADAPRQQRIVFRLKSPWCTGVLQHQPFYSCRARPK